MGEKAKQVSLFLPCLADLYYPALGRAAIKVLKQAGVRVAYPPDQTCCGQWAVNMGRLEPARSLARHFLRVFAEAEAVVSPSGSCVLTVRQHYPELFQGEPAWRNLAEEVAGRTYELTDFLVNVLGVIDLGASYNARATFHDSCHPLRGLGLKKEPRLLLSQVRGLELSEMKDSEVCCGFGGAFMTKYPSLSRALVEEKIDQARLSGAEIIIISEPGCLLNVDSALKARGSGLKAVPLLQVLAGRDGGGDG
ncbi:MAG: (Fe-S)-binding protein [Thermodesulfobacteriota bacterium]